jgi:hypothetical protein
MAKDERTDKGSSKQIKIVQTHQKKYLTPAKLIITSGTFYGTFN